MPFFTCDLTNLNRLSFAVADDPYYKPNRSKYYPELIIINKKGKIKDKVNPWDKKAKKYGLEFKDDFREPKLSLNDDKKI